MTNDRVDERHSDATVPAPAQHDRCILFVDCDRFYFSVEAAENPGLANDQRSVIIGHDPRNAPRGIVTTANDAARAKGIRSGMSAAQALRLAPDAIFLPPRHDLYARYSARVMAVLRAVSPLVQQNSIDEAACLWPHGFLPEPAQQLRSRVFDETRISVSIGIATSPLVAKMASEAAKTTADHLRIVLPGEEAAFLAPLPVRALIGVGPKAEQRLRDLGVETIGALAARPFADMVATFGRAYGRYLYEASRGIDDSELAAERTPVSLSDEHTFSHDTSDRRVLWAMLRGQAEHVAARLRREALRAQEVGIKIRYANWDTHTRQLRLPTPTDDPAVLAAAAATLMRRHWERGRPVRLIGLRVARFATTTTYEQLPLFDPYLFAGDPSSQS